MKTATIHTLGLNGLVSVPFPIRVTVGDGPQTVAIPSYPEWSAREATVRVRGSLENLGFYVGGRVTVEFPEFTPAHIPDPAFDLPIAIGALVALGAVQPERVHGKAFIGELGLDGAIRGVRGVYPRLQSAGRVVVPRDNAVEASYQDAHTETIAHLAELLAPASLPTVEHAGFQPDDIRPPKDVVLATPLVRAIEVAAAGNHPILMIGAFGLGKTLAARLLHWLLPPITPKQAAECTAIFSTGGMLHDHGHVTARPFRAPHHTVSEAGLVGSPMNALPCTRSGKLARPGEASFAHNGVLFLDEANEFRRAAIDSLARVIAAKEARVRTCSFPASPIIAAAVNSYDNAESFLSIFRRVPPWVREHCTIRVGCAHGTPTQIVDIAAMRARVHRAREILGLGSSLDRRHTIAETVAALAGSRTIEPEHVAEAERLAVVS